MFGLDAGVPELLLAKQLDYDAVIAHHPAGGKTITNFHHVFKRHVEQMVDVGISRAKAEKTVKKKLEQLETDAQTRNHDHSVDVARLLKMPYMNVHTPLDELGRTIMVKQISRATSKNATVETVVTELGKLSEFKNALTEIKILVGKAEIPTFIGPRGKLLKLFQEKFGKNIRIIEKVSDLKKTIEDLIVPAELQGMNKIYLPTGEVESKARLKLGDQNRLPAKASVLEEVIYLLTNERIRIAFE